MSRQEDYLPAVYNRWEEELPLIDADLTLHTDQDSLEQCVDVIRSQIAFVRRQQHR